MGRTDWRAVPNCPGFEFLTNVDPSRDHVEVRVLLRPRTEEAEPRYGVDFIDYKHYNGDVLGMTVENLVAKIIAACAKEVPQ